MKNDWYHVNTHKYVTAIGQSDYYRIVKLIVNEELDDVIPRLSQCEVEYVRDFEHSFWATVLCKEEDLCNVRMKLNNQYQGNRKSIAPLEFIPTVDNQVDKNFVWLLTENTTEDIISMILEYIRG